MVVFSNCKINIGLYITEKRADGYHNLETVFLPLPLYDVLELHDASHTRITVLGQLIPCSTEDNIVYKAYRLLKQDFPNLPEVHFHLLKNIPAGAGLGAGSANGAHALIALNRKFELNLSEGQLIAYAAALGSDCPFFIKNSPCFASGRGEQLEPLTLDLSAYQLIIVNPDIHISTPYAFSLIRPTPAPVNLKEVITLPVEKWRDTIINDFEEAIIKEHPEIEVIKNRLYAAGADFALMSGSGSTVYGLFKKDQEIVTDFPAHYYVKQLAL